MITETQRLYIELANVTDSPFFFKLMNSENWLNFIGNRGIDSQNKAKNYIQKSLIDSYEAYGYGLYKISLKETGSAIGICGFIKRDYLQYADIGFAVLPEYEGMGYIFEAATAVMAYGVNSLKLQPILAVTTPKNLRSRKLLNHIGLRQIDTIKPSEGGLEFLLFSNDWPSV